MAYLKVITSITLLVISQLVFAADDAPPAEGVNTQKSAAKNTASQEVPSIPDEDDEDQDSRNIPEPEVRIIRKKDTVIEEYRVNGRVRFVKITPSRGNPYYMIDTDGDGKLDTRNDNFTNPPINQWILLQW